MSLDEAIVEIEKKDVDFRSMRPTKRFARSIVEKVARQGDVSRPGYAVIPETRRLFGTKERAKRFQKHMMQEFWEYMKRNKPHLLRRNTTSLLPKNKRRQFDRQTELVLGSSYIKGHERGGVYFHFDFPNKIYGSLLYGDERNVKGGQTMMFDALRLARERGYPMKQMIHFHPQALRELGMSSWRHDQTQGFIEQGITAVNSEYITYVDVDNNQYPLLIFSNRYEDGILHTATDTKKINAEKGSAIRPIWSAKPVYVER